MWHKWIILVLVAGAGASGQIVSMPEGAQTSSVPGDSQAVLPLPQGIVVARYNKLRRGRDEQIAILLALLPDNCLVKPKRLGVFSIIPNSLDLDPAQGFTIRYGDGKEFSKDSSASYTSTPAGDVIFLKLKASRDLPPGDYTIHGKFGFHPAIKDICSQQQEVTIPVTVVDHDADVVKNEWPFQFKPEHHVGDTLLSILLFPLIPFAVILEVIACRGGCE
jgi:hypothetical protein